MPHQLLPHWRRTPDETLSLIRRLGRYQGGVFHAMDAFPRNAALSPEPARRLPGDRDVWIFICAELLAFSLFFIAYVIYRAAEVDLFNASQLSLSRPLGALNTLLLLSSSWAVVSSVHAARQDRIARVPRYLGLAIALGIGFMVVKYFEYGSKFAAGITLTTNTFYMLYFCLTMIHLLHVFGGTVILIVLCMSARAATYHAGNMRGLEAGASYWHMVDLLWIFLFALLYLLR
jgi:nitric oxide reductase NorE protein